MSKIQRNTQINPYIEQQMELLLSELTAIDPVRLRFYILNLLSTNQGIKYG